MNPQNLPTGKPYSFLMNKERPFSRQNPLTVNKESRKITKNPPLPKPRKIIKQIEEPRIIYTVPQRVIHASPQDFKDAVQRITGIKQPTGVSKVSPTARLPSTERTRSSWSNGDADMMRMLDNGVQRSQFPRLLLPEPAVLPPLPYENFLPPEMPQMLYNNFLPPRLPQMQHYNSLPTTLPQIQYNNSLPAPLPPVTTESLMQELFSPGNNVRIPPDSFLPYTWQEKPSDIFSPVALPQSDVFLPDTVSLLEFFSPEKLVATQLDNVLPDNWQPSDILLEDTCQPSATFTPERLPSTQSDNLFPDNCHPSDILLSDTCQPRDIFSPVTMPLAQSGNFSPDNSSLSDILSADTSEPLAQSDTFWTDPWQPIPLDNFSPVPLQPTPSDTWLSSDTFSPEISQPKPYEVFSPVLGQQSQTVLSYDGFWPENRIFAKPPEFIPADVVPPQTPSNQFNSFNYH